MIAPGVGRPPKMPDCDTQTAWACDTTRGRSVRAGGDGSARCPERVLPPTASPRVRRIKLGSTRWVYSS